MAAQAVAKPRTHSPQSPAMFTMEPPPLRSRAGSSYLTQRIAPVRRRSSRRCHSASSISATGARLLSWPAALKAQSIRP